MKWTDLKCALWPVWVRTLKFYDVWIAAVFQNVPVRAGAVLCAVLLSLLLQLSLQFLHLRTRALLMTAKAEDIFSEAGDFKDQKHELSV